MALTVQEDDAHAEAQPQQVLLTQMVVCWLANELQGREREGVGERRTGSGLARGLEKIGMAK